MKRKIAMSLGILAAAAMIAGCGNTDNKETSGQDSTQEASDSAGESSNDAESEADDTAASDFSGAINPISREEGSGTRGAFIELFGIETTDDAGNKVDNTTELAEVTNSTSVMMTTVAGNDYAIGYVSLGSLNDSVKALNIDGAEATVDAIKDGSYKISRPFNIVTTESVSETAQDFINFIMSESGQAVVEENGYISEGNTGAYEAADVSGKITVAGSSSVTPVMEKLAEAYQKVNTNVEIEVQQSDSTTGVTSAIEGICDIGMASRELKDSETEQGVSSQAIALDGIAVVVNQNNPINELTSEQVRQIFTGEVQEWADVQ